MIESLKIPDVKLIKNFKAFDHRGSFTKVFNTHNFIKYGLPTTFDEIYYSISHSNVIRGMHFQKPPMDHDKIVFVISGSIIDVAVDLRINSPTYGEYVALSLQSDETSVYIPKGFAHGFKSLEDNTVVVYLVGSIYSQLYDSGIKWDSFGFDWNIQNPIISERDSKFPLLKNFNSPFLHE